MNNEQEYLNPQRFPLTTQAGLDLRHQKMIDAHNLDELREMILEGEPLDPEQHAILLELETKLGHRQSKPGKMEPEVQSLSAQHSPVGGIRVAGKFYECGQFIPDEALEQATDDELALLLWHHEQKRMVDAVNPDDLREMMKQGRPLSDRQHAILRELDAKAKWTQAIEIVQRRFSEGLTALCDPRFLAKRYAQFLHRDDPIYVELLKGMKDDPLAKTFVSYWTIAQTLATQSRFWLEDAVAEIITKQAAARTDRPGSGSKFENCRFHSRFRFGDGVEKKRGHPWPREMLMRRIARKVSSGHRACPAR